MYIYIYDHSIVKMLDFQKKCITNLPIYINFKNSKNKQIEISQFSRP